MICFGKLPSNPNLSKTDISFCAEVPGVKVVFVSVYLNAVILCFNLEIKLKDIPLDCKTTSSCSNEYPSALALSQYIEIC